MVPFEIEPRKRAKYSKSLEPDEIEEVPMDEELEETDEMMEPRVPPPHPQKMKMMTRKPRLHFGLQEPGIRRMYLTLLDLQMVSTNQLPPI